MKLKADAVCWKAFTRHSDAVFRSLGREIRIGVLSVATLAVATPDCAVAQVSAGKAAVQADSTAERSTNDDERLSAIDLTEMEVVGTRAPLPADKAVRIVQVITRKDIEASSANSVNDLLKLAAGVDVRQRGAFGIQTDIGINGGNSDQLTVLLNGINITNPHTGHLTADLPVTVNDIDHIEVIEGGASRVYGLGAFAGAINIVTRSEAESLVGVNVAGGSYGTAGADAYLNLLTGSFANRISGGYSRSDGAAPNSDFQKHNVFWNEKYSGNLMDLRFQAGMSSMKYGANTFYGTGSTSQYEENNRYLVSLQGETKGRVKLSPQIYWNRSYDHYVWTRSKPSAYENYHQTNVYGAVLNASTRWKLGQTSLGVEFRRENILSTRLGLAIPEQSLNMYPGYKYKDGRSDLGIYLEHNVILQRWSISAGLLSEYNTKVDGGMRFYPGVDVSYTPIDGMRLYASFNQSLRLPTFTDLYYNGPGIEGCSELRPEKSTDFAFGISYTRGAWHSQIKGFYRKGTDMIDWVKKPDASVWTKANSDIDNAGVEFTSQVDFTRFWGKYAWLQAANVSYCYINQYRVNKEETSTYANQLVYLRHKFTASLRHRIVSRLSAQWEFQLKDRTGWFDNALTGESQTYGKVANLDVKLSWTAPRYTLYVQGNNILNRKYYDIPNVQQPGFWFMGGAKINFRL